MSNELDIIINWIDEQIVLEEQKRSTTKKQYDIGVIDGKIKAFQDTKCMLEFAKYAKTIQPINMEQLRERKCQE